MGAPPVRRALVGSYLLEELDAPDDHLASPPDDGDARLAAEQDRRRLGEEAFVDRREETLHVGEVTEYAAKPATRARAATCCAVGAITPSPTSSKSASTMARRLRAAVLKRGDPGGILRDGLRRIVSRAFRRGA